MGVTSADMAPAPCAALFPLVREQTYLDTATMGLSSSAMAEAAAQFYRDKATGCLGRHHWQERVVNLRRRIAAWLQVEIDDIEFFSGTTDALNLLAHSIDWQTGDEVIVAADEFPSVRLAWGAAERAGASIRLVDIVNERQRSEALVAAISPRTRVVVVAHVHSITGTRVDLDGVGEACRRREIWFIVDGIQALGATPVSLQYVDAYAAGVIKWLLAGFGLAICVIREPLRRALRPAFRGYLNAPPDARMQFAHCNYPGLYALEESLRLMGDVIKWDTVHDRTAQLVEWLAEDLQALGAQLAAPPGARAGIASFAVRDAENARMALANERVIVAARGRYLRASPFFYNSRDDVRTLATLVRPFL